MQANEIILAHLPKVCYPAPHLADLDPLERTEKMNTKKSTDELHFGAFSDHDSQVDVNKRKIPQRINLTGLATQGYSAPVKKKNYTAAEVIEILKKKQGSKRDFEFAAELGITQPYLCDLYKGRRFPGDKILSYLGMVKRQPDPFYEVA